LRCTSFAIGKLLDLKPVSQIQHLTFTLTKVDLGQNRKVKVKYTYGDSANGTSTDTGLALLAAIRAAINENNTIKAHIQRTDGNSQYGADYGFGNYDMTFNPGTGEFQNIKGWGAQAALEHKWTPTLTTAIGGGYMSMDPKNFQAKPHWMDRTATRPGLAS
jgi:hypothetical protein